MKNNENSIVSWLSAFVLSTNASLYQIMTEMPWLQPIYKILLTFLLGIIGGFAGLLGKRIFEYFEKKYENRQKDVIK